MRSHSLNKTRAISAIETDMLAIGGVINNLYLHYDYLVSKSLHAEEIGVIKLCWSISTREQT